MNGWKKKYKEWVEDYRFYPLTLSLLLLLLVPASIKDVATARIMGALLFTLMLLCLANIAFATPRWLWLAGIGLIFSLLLTWFPELVGSSVFFTNIRFIVLFLVFLGATTLVLRQLTLYEDIDLNMFSGAISGYFLIGITGGFWFGFLAVNNSEALSESIENMRIIDLVFLSFSNLTALSFDDILPQSKLAKMSALILTIMGQLYFAVVIGIIVGKYIDGGKSK